MPDWRAQLRCDPLPPLLGAMNPALAYWAQRDLLAEAAGPVESLWTGPQVERWLRKQRADGSWPYPGARKASVEVEDYDQIETFRALGELVGKYGLHRGHPAIARAAEFLFKRQTAEGDFRGIYGRQYTPNYTGAIMELLIQAGYEDDPRTLRGFDWLLAVRQNDGGWAIPLSVAAARWDAPTLSGPPLPFNPARPFSHMVTGVVLRAFAAHPRHRHSPAADAAAGRVAGRFFRRDTYPGRQGADFWTRFSYPFWFTDLLSALDSICLITPTGQASAVRQGLEWLVERQGADGAWNLALLRSGGDKATRLWVSLGICRVLRRVAEGETNSRGGAGA